MSYQTIAELWAAEIAHTIGDTVAYILRLALLVIIRTTCWLVPVCWRGVVVLALLLAFCARLTVKLAVNVYRWHKYSFVTTEQPTDEPYITTQFVVMA